MIDGKRFFDQPEKKKKERKKERKWENDMRTYDNIWKITTSQGDDCTTGCLLFIIYTVYYQNKPKFNGAYSGNNLTKIKDEAYIINLDKYKVVGTYQIAFDMNGDNAIFFDSFGVEHIHKEMKKQK